MLRTRPAEENGEPVNYDGKFGQSIRTKARLLLCKHFDLVCSVVYILLTCLVFVRLSYSVWPHVPPVFLALLLFFCARVPLFFPIFLFSFHSFSLFWFPSFPQLAGGKGPFFFFFGYFRPFGVLLAYARPFNYLVDEYRSTDTQSTLSRGALHNSPPTAPFFFWFCSFLINNNNNIRFDLNGDLSSSCRHFWIKKRDNQKATHPIFF